MNQERENDMMNKKMITIYNEIYRDPHPEKTTDKGAVKSVRKFLGNAGVEL